MAQWLKCENEKLLNLDKVIQIRVISEKDQFGNVVWKLVAIADFPPIPSTIAKGSHEDMLGLLEKFAANGIQATIPKNLN